MKIKDDSQQLIDLLAEIAECEHHVKVLKTSGFITIFRKVNSVMTQVDFLTRIPSVNEQLRGEKTKLSILANMDYVDLISIEDAHQLGEEERKTIEHLLAIIQERYEVV